MDGVKVGLNKPGDFKLETEDEPIGLNKSLTSSKSREVRDKAAVSKEFVFPLYFGWEIIFRRITDWQKHIVGPFKKYWQYLAAVCLLIIAVSSYIFINNQQVSQAATYNWVQSDWSGGLDGGDDPIHTDNKTNWDKYSQSDDLIATSTDLTLTATSTSVIQTSDTDFNAGATTSVEVLGSGDDASVSLSLEELLILDSVISAGPYHTCAVISDGSVYCWGQNSYGQLGDNSTSQRLTPVRVQDGEQTPGESNYLENVTRISVGEDYTCALISDGSAYCWGYNNNGQLGDNSTSQRLTPVRVQDGEQTPGESNYIENVIQISSLNYGLYPHTCAIISDGSAYCWGYNGYGQLGDNTTIQRTTPVRVLDGAQNSGTYLINVSQISLGYYQTCAVISDGSAYCWGYNGDGQLGNNSTTESHVPVRVRGGAQGGTYLANASKISLGLWFACAVISDGSMYCWGDNDNGQLGDGTEDTDRLMPVRVLDGEQTPGETDYLENISQISANNNTTCAVISDDSAYCWGDNTNGQLGDGTVTQRTTPVRVLDGAQDSGTYLINISQISANLHTCAVISDGSAYCWGDNTNGQLGDGTEDTDRTTPVRVLDGAQDIDTYIDLTIATYETSGNFISEIIDTAGNIDFGTALTSSTTPANTTISVKIRTDSNDNMSGATAWASCDAIINGADISSNNCVTDGQQYLQYQVLFTSDSSDTPTFSDITINYNHYADASLISSTYNTESDANVLAGVKWDEDEDLPVGTGVTMYIRASSTAELLADTTWVETASTTAAGYITTGCSKAGSTITCANAVIPTAMKDAAGDQWIQYKITLIGSANAPVVDNITMVYVVNAPPEVQNVIASQGSDGLVNISYEVRDGDGASGTVTSLEITPSFQYWNGASWSNCVTLSAGAADNKAVEEVDYTSYSLTWDPKTDWPNHFLDGTAQIKVIANDNEMANNTASTTSAVFILDTTDPVVDIAKIDSTADTITFSITEDSVASATMLLSNDADYSADGLNDDSGAWVDYAESVNWIFTGEPETVYYQIKDSYGNLATSSITAPAVPTNLVYQDISNLETSEWREFIAWGEIAAPNPGFKRYNIYRSTDGTNYSLLTTETDIAVNYLVDTGVANGTTYYYKLSAEDDNDSISNYSAVVSDEPDGQGGSDLTSPTISGVTVATTTTQSVNITWNTNEPASSLVEYITETGGDFSSAPGVTVATMADTVAGLGIHSVWVTGLTASTTYYYQVKSTDPSSNTGTSKQGVDGYTFTTNQGPVISNVSASTISNASSTITWITTIASNSQVIYSANSNLSGSITITSSDSGVTSHSAQITGLTQGTKYYYYVRSTDAESNVATDNNGGDYYTFTTLADNVAPTISNIANSIITDTKVLITWEATEESNALVNYSTTTASYTNTASNSSFNLSQSVQLTGLTASSTYYYQVVAADINGNATTSAEYTFATLETLSEESDVVAREDTAREEGTVTVITLPCGGGGGGGYRKSTVPPEISSVQAATVTYDTANIVWQTNETAISFVEYGLNGGYDAIAGDYTYATAHEMLIEKLLPDKEYQYRVINIDNDGNTAMSDPDTFITYAFSSISELEEDSATSTSNAEEESTGFIDTMQSVTNYIARMASKVTVETYEYIVNEYQQSIDDLSVFVPPPKLVNQPAVIVGSNTALVSWFTDKEANSFISYAPESYYNRENGYQQTISNSDIYAKSHQVYIAGLEPKTVYHYQIKSKGQLGLPAVFDNFTFTTNEEQAEIKNFTFNVISPESAEFRWTTTVETNSKLRYIPYRNNTLMVDEAHNEADKAFTSIHSLTADNLESGVIYQVEIYGEDANSNVVSKIIPAFSTSDSDLPPVIANVKTDTALSFGKNIKVQAIISWQTNEPSISRVYYQKGLAKENEEGKLSNSTPLNQYYSKEHVAVITTFEPGSIYKFQVESMDSAGNASQSRTYTILTPRQSESVFQVIMKNIEQTFGWLKFIKE